MKSNQTSDVTFGNTKLLDPANEKPVRNFYTEFDRYSTTFKRYITNDDVNNAKYNDENALIISDYKTIFIFGLPPIANKCLKHVKNFTQTCKLYLNVYGTDGDEIEDIVRTKLVTKSTPSRYFTIPS